MSSYFIPSPPSSNNSDHVQNGRRVSAPNYSRFGDSRQSAQVSGYSDSDLDASIEYGRGTPVGLPPFLRQHQREAAQDAQIRPAEEEPGRYPFLQKYEEPMEIRRRIPGCGINHYDPFDEPVRAERSPIHPQSPVLEHNAVENLFDQFDNDPSVEAMLGRKKFVREHFQRNTYSRSRQARRPAPKFRPGAAMVLTSTEQAIASTQSQQELLLQRQPKDIRYPFSVPLGSPFSLSSSSSSADSSPESIHSFSQFAPLDQSSFVRTPPQGLQHNRSGRAPVRPPKHRAFLPSSQESDTLSVASFSGFSTITRGESDEESFLSESPFPTRLDVSLKLRLPHSLFAPTKDPLPH